MQYFLTPSALPENATTSALIAQLQAVGLPVTDVQTSNAYPGQVIVVCSTALSNAQSTQMTNLVSAWDPRPRMKRGLSQIYSDVAALSTTQQGNIWGDFGAGNPPKYLLDTGANTGAIVVLDWVVRKSGASGAALLDAQIRAVAMYTQDNVKYLVTPTFDPSINIPGDMPIA